jgi:hypothetical protein
MHRVRAAHRVDEMNRFSGGQPNQHERENAGRRSKPGRPRHARREASSADPERHRDCPSQSRLELTQERRCKRRARREKDQQ